MKAANTLVPNQPEEKKSFSLVMTGKTMQDMLAKSLGSARAAARFTSTLISVVSASPALAACKPASIVSAALRGEGMGLILGHGYYVVPYGDTATYIPSAKGYIQLAMSTGFYADIDVIEVREGEHKGRNRRTGKPNIDLSVYATDEEREQHPVIGYYAYFELKDGTFRAEYWPMEKLLKHADRYSAAFSLEKYRKMQAGELDAKEVEKLLRGTPWYDESGGQAKMCCKTMTRQLLNSGYAPLSNEVRSFIREDTEGGDGVIVPAPFAEDDPIPAANPDTGEVVEMVEAETVLQATETPVESVLTSGREKTRGSTKNAATDAQGGKAAANRTDDAEEEDLNQSFFGR